jgi:hypothetical protein
VFSVDVGEVLQDDPTTLPASSPPGLGRGQRVRAEHDLSASPGGKAPQGPERRLSGGKIKFGYRAENGPLVRDEKEQRPSAESRPSAPRENPCEIAKVLNREGRKSRTSDVWHPGMLGLIVKRMKEVA